MSDGPVLKVEGLRVQYGASVVAVRGVDLSVETGESVGIIGINGAGKTSLITACSGLLASQPAKITRGRVTLDGHEITKKSPNRISRLGFTVVPERDKVFPHLTIGEHLGLAGGAAALETLGALPPAFDRLLKHRRDLAGSLSGGERQLLALLSALAQRPKVLAVDEFTLGLSPAAIDMVAGVAEWALSRLGLTLIVVDQNLALIQRLCGRMVVMRGGQVVADDATSAFSTEAVKELHLK